MAREFTWRPLLETPGNVRFRVLGVQFGDGYKQTAGDGINNRLQSWNLTFRGTSQEIDQIKQFLDEHQGHIAFLWTPKDGPQALFDCAEYNKINHTENGRNTGIWTLNATFNERFAP